MYEIIYNLQGDKISIKKEYIFIPIAEDNKDYRQYLKDIIDGAEVIDEPPTKKEIAIYEAEQELAKTDSKIPRTIEDIYDVLSATQKSNLATPTKQSIEDKKAKRQAYLDLL